MTAILFAVALNSKADFAAGGGKSTSGHITNDASISSIGGISQGAGTEIKSGFVGQIYDVSGLLITATPSIVPSGGASKLSPSAILDDSTVIVLSPEEVAWDTPTFPIANITPSGQLTASTVTTTTNGTVGAHYQNVSAKTTITVSPQILPPTITNQTVVVGVNSSQTIQLEGNDPQGLPLFFIIQAQPAHGRLGSIQGNQILYTPDTNFTGMDQFTFFATNSAATSSVGTVSITVSKLDQTITFDTLPTRFNGDPPFKLVASASSGLPVTFAILTGPARISGDILTITGTGSITVRATQSGNATYNPAQSVDQTFRANSPIGNLISVKRFPGTNAVKIALSLFGRSGPPPQSFTSFDSIGRNGGTIFRDGQRLAFIPASSYAPDSFTCIVQETNGVLVTNTVSVTVIDTLVKNTLQMLTEAPDFVIGYAGETGRLCTIKYSTNLSSGWTLLGYATETAPGIYQYRDQNPGDAQRFYTVEFTSKLAQTITWTTLPDKLLGDPPFPLQAAASSGLPITYTLVSGPALLTNNTLTLIATGTITLRATQAGNTVYNPAPSVEQTFHVISPIGRLISIRRFPGTNIVNIATNVLVPSGSILVSCDVKAKNGGTLLVEGNHLAFTPASIHGSDFFNYIVRNSSITVTNTVTITPIEDMQNDVLYILMEAGDFVLGFAGVSQATYEILYSDDLATWATLGNAIESASGIFQLRNAAPQSAHRFYRVHKK